jgi:hypothetical protein
LLVIQLNGSKRGGSQQHSSNKMQQQFSRIYKT